MISPRKIARSKIPAMNLERSEYEGCGCWVGKFVDMGQCFLGKTYQL